MLDYTIYDLDEESIKLYVKCFEENNNQKSIDIVRWQFNKKNIIDKYVKIAYDTKKNKTAGIYATSALNFKIGKNVVQGLQSLDTITDTNYRGQGLFIELSNKVYSQASENNVGLVFGFPNGNSIHGFKNKLNWEILDPVPFLIKPLQSGYFTKKFSRIPNFKFPYLNLNIQKKFDICDNQSFPKEVDNLWIKFSSQIPVCVQRDKDYLDWRYVEKPNSNYKILHCYDRDKQYLGFVVYTLKKKHNGLIGYIMELIFDLQHPKAAKQLLKTAVNDLRSNNADCILAWCLKHSPNYSIFRNQLFFNLPNKLRPIELHFGVKTFSNKYKGMLSERKNWYLSYSDSDTV